MLSSYQCQWLLFRFLVVSSLFTSRFTLLHSRTLPPPQTTINTTFDVSASIQKTFHVLSIDPEAAAAAAIQTLQEEQWSTSSSLTLQLHSRTLLHKSPHSDYKSLIMSRLDRDSSRVRSLTTRLDLAVKGIAKSDLKPIDTTRVFESEDIETPIISGTSLGSGEYFSRVGIGSPSKQVYMVIDTGSDINWVQCAPCADCYQQSDPIFDPSSSSSYSSLSCKAQQCTSLDVSECRNDTCLYEVSYGDGSYTVGDFVTETVTFSGSVSVDNIAIGCGHNNEGLFVAAAGLIGLGGGSLSLLSQINASSFSYCLVDRDSDSASTLEFDSPLPPNAVTAPLLRNRQLDTFFYIGLTGFSVGGELLPIPESLFRIDDKTGDGGIIIDSGTAVTRLQTEVYNSLRDAFVRGTQHLPSTNGVALFDTCYDLSSKTSVEVPAVSLHFPDGKTLALPANNYMIPLDSSGTFCFAFAPTSSALSIIGNVQQQGTRVGFDLDNSVIWFSPNKC